jgi:hypothetical protein
LYIEDDDISFDNDKYCLRLNGSAMEHLVVAYQRFPEFEGDKKTWYPIGKLKMTQLIFLMKAFQAIRKSIRTTQ